MKNQLEKQRQTIIKLKAEIKNYKVEISILKNRIKKLEAQELRPANSYRKPEFYKKIINK